MASTQPNATMVKFGYPASLVHQYDHWVVLARPAQCTLGALVLVNTSAAQSFAEIGEASFRELNRVTQDIEQSLKSFREFQKINYLMLMMVDKEVHFHVIPRYEHDQEFDGAAYTDPGWPMAPDLAAGPVLEGDDLASLVSQLQRAWVT